MISINFKICFCFHFLKRTKWKGKEEKGGKEEKNQTEEEVVSLRVKGKGGS